MESMEETTCKVYALIPAAGSGVRFGSSENKVFAPLLGRPLLGWTLQAFADCDAVDAVIIIGSEPDLPRLREIGEQFGGGKVVGVVTGGGTRQESVRLGLSAIPETATHVAVHDAARCCVTPELIAHTVVAAKNSHGAATAAYPVSDSLARGERNNTLQSGAGIALLGEYVDRAALWSVQTPQTFDAALLRHAHQYALDEGLAATDDASFYQRYFFHVAIVPASPENIKVTRPEDLELAEAILARRLAKSSSTPSVSTFRVGHGYDVHQFAVGRPLWLGGVHFVESPVGLLGHSDADALLHAVCDALLGAAGMGDIGVLFPPSDMAHKDRRSIEFLDEVKARLDAEGWRVGNVDISVLAEMPKIAPRAGTIRETIAVSLGISADAVSVKATTNEKMGFVGRGEGIAVHATVLIQR
ncbi:MAG: 2-C-methyl-D-erythritol 4-phosphate cytidylyltransferase [Armatimonadetes bacterium]|nr:2-C-methyl-D-erythritol 4-phosphate cytidylyltransferase [Armatimonadota bacterium]